MRKVFVLENGGAQKKLSFEIDETSVKTLGDLLPIIEQNGISTENKAYYESKSHSQLMDNESVLPANEADNGKLIIMVSTAQKKISNGLLEGAKRPEINDFVRKNNLGAAIKEAFGVSWTNVPSSDIVKFVNSLAPKKESEVADVYNRAVAYVEDCEDDEVRSYLLSVIGANADVNDEDELAGMNCEDLFPWVK